MATASSDYDWRLSVEGAGEALVLVPGMDGTGQLFYRQVPSLARTFRTATYALRSDARSMDTLVDDLGHVIDTVAPDTTLPGDQSPRQPEGQEERIHSDSAGADSSSS